MKASTGTDTIILQIENISQVTYGVAVSEKAGIIHDKLANDQALRIGTPKRCVYHASPVDLESGAYPDWLDDSHHLFHNMDIYELAPLLPSTAEQVSKSL